MGASEGGEGLADRGRADHAKVRGVVSLSAVSILRPATMDGTALLAGRSAARTLPAILAFLHRVLG
jgi:hypothetical protein